MLRKNNTTEFDNKSLSCYNRVLFNQQTEFQNDTNRILCKVPSTSR